MRPDLTWAVRKGLSTRGPSALGRKGSGSPKWAGRVPEGGQEEGSPGEGRARATVRSRSPGKPRAAGAQEGQGVALDETKVRVPSNPPVRVKLGGHIRVFKISEKWSDRTGGLPGHGEGR